MAKIEILDEILANKIAAGEVVERASSVVKELVENSIDAKSTEVKIELIEAGTKEITVIDNGSGMSKDDAVMAFSRHATSKLKTEFDLYNINTLGFRGEALPSIASVSEVSLKTSTGDAGTNVIVNGGKLIKVESSDARVGTTIKISNLFYNTPARLKHMKSLHTELANVVDFVNKIALSHPNIKFTLKNNDTILLNTEGKGDLLKVIHNIYGLDITKKMLHIEGENNDYSLNGYISMPEINKSNRNAMTVIVNGRVVRNMELNRIINEAYTSYKPDNRYPVIVLNISTDPSIIDVNIHPTKMDIKFSKMEELSNLIKNLIENKIGNKNLIPTVEKKEIDYEKIEIQKIDFTAVSEPLIKDFPVVESEPEKIDIKSEEKETLPILFPVGLIHGTYIVCENEEGMYLIDQHAAKERINYEMYKEKLSNPSSSVTDMLFPYTVELSNNEFLIIKENINLLKDMNFEVEEFGINSLIFKSHPIWLPTNYEIEAIKKIIEVIIQTEKNFDFGKFNDTLAKALSCKISIKANTNITNEEMNYLINDLGKCKNPYNCPHGRPTIIHYSKNDLEKEFKRTGF